MRFTHDADRAFDLWLTRSLTRQYAAALTEAVPEELLALLREPPAPAQHAGGQLLRRDQVCSGNC